MTTFKQIEVGDKIDSPRGEYLVTETKKEDGEIGFVSVAGHLIADRRYAFRYIGRGRDDVQDYFKRMRAL